MPRLVRPSAIVAPVVAVALALVLARPHRAMAQPAPGDAVAQSTDAAAPAPQSDGDAATPPATDAGAGADDASAGGEGEGEGASTPLPTPTDVSAPPPFAPAPVVQVVLDPPIPGENPWARAGLFPGAMLDPAIARQALRTALGSGTFAEARATVRATPRGLVLTIAGERRVRLREVAFSGIAQRPLETARADFGIAPSTWVSDLDVARARDRLQLAYQEAGWTRAQVTTQWRATDDPAIRVLIVRVQENPPTTIRRVVLEGVPRAHAESVREALGFGPGDVADPQLARRAFDPLSAVLRRAGYLTAALAQVRFAPVGPGRADAVVSVRAGPLFRTEWRGVTLFASRVLAREMRIEEERGLETTTLNVLVGRVRDYYVRRGFLDVRVRAEIVPDPPPATSPAGAPPASAVLRFTVREGAQVLVRRVTFPGAREVSQAVLRDALHDVVLAELPGGELFQDPRGHIEAVFDQANASVARPWSARVRLEPERTYVPDLYAEAARRMVARYRELGYLDAAVAPPVVTRVRDAQGAPALDVAFRVTEGPRTVFDEVRFEGNDVVPSERLAREADLRLGVALSYARLEEARARIVDYYRERGHMFARVTPEIDRSPDRTLARVRFVVHEGPEVRVGALVIRGNERTQEAVIRPRVALRQGELWRPSLVRTTQRQLGELGVFAGVTVTPFDPDVEAPVKDVVVQLVELRPQFLDVRGGLSTGEGLRVGFDYGYRNLAGMGITALAGVQGGYPVFVELLGDPAYAANLRQLPVGALFRGRGNVSLVVPLGPLARLSVEGLVRRIIERQFAINTLSAAATLALRPTPRLALGFTPEISGNGLDLLGATSVNAILADARANRPGDLVRLQRLLLLPVGFTGLFALRVTAAIDLRDQVFNPTRGLYISMTAEYVKTLTYDPPRGTTATSEPGDTLRGIGSVTTYVPLPFGIVWASNLRGGINLSVDPPQAPGAPRRVTYTNRLFFLGGPDSLRGWLQDTYIPQDVRGDLEAELRRCAAANPGSAVERCQPNLFAVQRNGDVFVNWRNELRIPIGSTGFAVGAFLDIGNLWKDIARVEFKFAFAAGLGIRYVTPIGPVALDYGFNLAPQCFLHAVPDDPSSPCASDVFREIPGALHFSIGLF